MIQVDFIFSFIAIIIGVTVHEFCHAWVANLLGDPTGKYMGRITLNPLAHFDPLGTLALIFFGIGWGKPVPFNPDNLKHPKRDSALISLAGPAANFLSAIAVAIPLKYLQGTQFDETAGYRLLGALFWISIFLFSLNVLPFPPLDGSKIIGIFIPRRFSYHYEIFLQHGTRYFLIFILLDAFLVKAVIGFSFLTLIVGTVAQWVAAIVSLGT